MSLTSSLQIGTSALNAAQLAIQVAGNNLSNAATPGYSRQVALLSPSRPTGGGRFLMGTGVQVSGVRRQVDQAQERIRAALAKEPDNSSFLDTAAVVALAAGHPEEALEHARHAARLNPDDPYLLWQVTRLEAKAVAGTSPDGG